MKIPQLFSPQTARMVIVVSMLWILLWTAVMTTTFVPLPTVPNPIAQTFPSLLLSHTPLSWMVYTPSSSSFPFGCVSLSALSQAAAYGAPHSVSDLVHFGALKDVVDSCGATPLHYAAVSSSPHAHYIVYLLLKAGADPSLKDMAGNTPRDVASGTTREAFVHFQDRPKSRWGNDPDEDPFFVPSPSSPPPSPAARDLAENRAKELGFGQLNPIDRWNASELTVEIFRNAYQIPRVPVILEGMLETMFPDKILDREVLRETCGRSPVTMMRFDEEAEVWGGLLTVEPEEPVRLADIISAAIGEEPETSADLDNVHVFDWSFIGNCAETVDATGFTIPAHFAADLFQKMDPVKAACSRCLFWPSLFVQQSGSRSGLHQDARHTHFWQLLVAGKKEWLVFPPTQSPNLYHGGGSHFGLDGFDPDLDRFPRAKHIRGWHAQTKPGDLLFIPAHSPHQVANLDAPIALSSNFVDDTNYHLYLNDLRADEDVTEELLNSVIDLQTQGLTKFLPHERVDKRYITEYRHTDITLGEFHQQVAASRADAFGVWTLLSSLPSRLHVLITTGVLPEIDMLEDL